MRTKLLSCPFCNGPALQRSDTKYNRNWVKCEVCGACPGDSVPNLATAIARWNRRYPCNTLDVPSPPPAEREADEN